MLDHDADALRVDVTLDWREHAHLLKLRFPAALADASATFEIPFGGSSGRSTARRSRRSPGSTSPARSDGGRAGLTVVNNAKHGYDASPAATRCAEHRHHRRAQPRLRLARPAARPRRVYTFQDQGVQRFSLPARPARRRPAGRRIRCGGRPLLGSPVRAMLESFHGGALPRTRSFAGAEGDGLLVTALKGSEDAVDGGGGPTSSSARSSCAGSRASTASRCRSPAG